MGDWAGRLLLPNRTPSEYSMRPGYLRPFAALSLAAGASFKEAAVLANLAAGIVVEKLGTATVTPAELMDAVSTRLKK